MRAAAAACRARISATPGTVSAPSRTTGAGDDGVPRRRRPAAQPRLDRVGRARPANATPSCGQHDQVAGGARRSARRSRPARPRQAAPPRVAMSSTSRAVMPAGPVRCRPSSSAARDSIHSDALSVEEDPSQPSPTGHAGRAQLAHRGEPAAADAACSSCGQCATPDAGRAEPGHLGGVRVDAVRHPGPRSVSQPTSSNCSTGRRPNRSRQ